jgi:hypothetical protein
VSDKPWYYQSAGERALARADKDSVAWTAPPRREEDDWFIKKTPDRACKCGDAAPGDWSAGMHHGIHKCSKVIVSITGNKRVHI